MMKATTIQKKAPVDEVMAEVHRVKDGIAEDYGYDIRKMIEALRKEQAEGGRRVVDLSATDDEGDRDCAQPVDVPPIGLSGLSRQPPAHG